MSARRCVFFVALVIGSVLVGAEPSRAAVYTWPGQPTSGPGGSDYCFSDWSQSGPLSSDADPTKTHDDYWLYRPAGTWNTGACGTTPTVVPLVVMLHGYSADGTPDVYLRFMKHLVRKRGAIVVFPRYGAVDQGGFPPPGNYPFGAEDWTNNAIRAVSAAITLVDGGTGIKTDHNDGIQIVGNSAGGIVGFNFAARALDGSQQDLPSWATPKSLFAVQPGIDSNLTETGTNQDNLWDDLSSLPTAMRFTCMTSEHDTPSEWAGEIGCDRMWRKAVARGVTGREILHVRSDAYGWPSLKVLYADHGMMVESTDPAQDNTLDHHGIWKIAEALKECTTENLNCSYAYGGDKLQLGMGRWIVDGVETVAVNPMIRWTDPNNPSTPINPNTDCSPVRPPYSSPPSFYLPCPQFRSPSIGAPTGTGNGFEWFEYDARTNGIGHNGDQSSAGFAWNIDGTGDQHLFWDFDTDNLLETMRVQGNQVLIDGIEVKLDWAVDSTSGEPKYDVQLSRDGGLTWSPSTRTTSAAGAANTEITSVLGGTTDKWGWSSLDVHHVPKTYSTVDTVSELGDDFRVRVKSTCTFVSTCTSGGRDFFLDHVSVKVHWHIRDNLLTDPGLDGLGATVPSAWTQGGGSAGCIYRISSAFNCTGGTDLLGEYQRTQWVQTTGQTNRGIVSQNVTIPSGSGGMHRLEALGRMGTAGHVGYVALYNGGSLLCYLSFNTASWAHKYAENCNVPTGGATVTVMAVSDYDTGQGYRLYFDAVKLVRL